jgi:hypothetical protein
LSNRAEVAAQEIRMRQRHRNNTPARKPTQASTP